MQVSKCYASLTLYSGIGGESAEQRVCPSRGQSLIPNPHFCDLINDMRQLLLGLAFIALPAAAQTPTYRAPRTAGGHPDLNGIWQALNEANYDIEAHVARAALALRPGPYGPVPAVPVLALGAVGSVPPGLGVVDGELPYKPEALAKKKQNRDNWLTSDPEIKCYLPGVPRATYMPYPFQILESASAIGDRLRIRRRGPQHLS